MGEQARYYFENELVSWFVKAGLKDAEAEVIEHNIPYLNEERARGNIRIGSRLKQVKSRARRAKIEKEFHELLKNLEKYGEEWLPTLLVVGTRKH